MVETLDTVLLLALPASGKSEVRRYLKQLPPESCKKDFHLGPTVQLDDFPYVHLMRRIDDVLASLGQQRVYFHSPEKPFANPKDWGTLVALLNEDYDALRVKPLVPKSASSLLFDRLEAAAKKVGIPPRLGRLEASVLKSLGEQLEKDSRQQLQDRIEGLPVELAGKTLVIEFARGGPQGSKFPLPEPFGYRHSLSLMSEEILKKAVILYVWVTPDESRRKNQERANPNDPGSILHHGVPIEVMLNDYGCDDMDWLEANAETPGTISILAHGKKFHIPVARFDNRVDKTSFIRNDPSKWKPEQIQGIHQGLKQALEKLSTLQH
jgi:hypothetical protein